MDRAKCRELLVKHFNEVELQTLCFDLGIDHELPGHVTRVELVIELIELLERRNRVNDLSKFCRRERPNIDWDCFHGDGDEPPIPRELLPYLSRLLEQTQWLNLSGIDHALAVDRVPLSLASVYVELKTFRTEVPERKEGRIEEFHEPRRVSVVEVMNQRDRLVLLGDPGSGKSTFVDFITICLAGEGLGHEEINLRRLAKWNQGWILPVRVVLRDFVARGQLPPVGERATADHLWRFMQAELGDTLADLAPRLHTHLRDRGGLIMLDGFDEVPDAEERRQQIIAAILGFATDFPKCRFLLTTRTYAWQRQLWHMPGFAEVQLAPFDDEQVETFIDRWYALQPSGISSEEAENRADALKGAIKRTPELRKLADRPLLLTLMASLHAWRGGDLPEKRELLYNDTLELLLYLWEQRNFRPNAQGQLTTLPAVQEWLRAPRDRILQVLQQLAYEVHAGQVELEGTADVPENVLVTALWNIRGDPDLKLERIVEYIRDRAGLLVPQGVGVYAFVHRTFQEYLAARYLTETDWPDKMADLVLEDPERWREVALLAAAKACRGTSYAAWSLIHALASPQSLQEPDRRQAWVAFIAAAAITENGLHEHIPRAHKETTTRLRSRLVSILEMGLLVPTERAAVGRTLARLGDPRFCADIWYLPNEPLLGFVKVSEGPFLMGTDREVAQAPQHTVIVPKFYIARYPVTVAQFQAFVEESGYRRPKNLSSSVNFSNHPMVNVNWYDALAYCKWLTAKLRTWENLPEELAALLLSQEEPWCVTLPSEAEWEKAARGLDGRSYPWGNEPDPYRANYVKTGIGSTTAVGCFSNGASPYRIHELSGNVWEWTRSLWGHDKGEFKYPYNATDGRENIDAHQSSHRVRRGGSFQAFDYSINCTFRHWYSPSKADRDIGFRVVISSFNEGK